MVPTLPPRVVCALVGIFAAVFSTVTFATPMDHSWDLASVAGSPVTVQASGASTFSGTIDAARAYLRTNKSDFHNTSFVAEVNVTVNNGSGNGCAFVGLGAGIPDSGFYQEPRTTPVNYLRLAPSDFSSGYLTFNENAVSSTVANPGPGNGTHRVRLIWDAATRRLQTDVDANSTSGVFIRDYGRVNYSSATGFAAGTGRLFVGGAGGVSFGPLSVRAATANDLALIDRSAPCWMTAINGSLKPSQFTIPGTHNSAARVENWPSTAKCQHLTIADQLNIGVRYLDARCRHIGDSFSIHHGEVYQEIRFGEVLQQVYDFLGNNPGETVMMSVKEEHTASGNTRSFEATFDAYVAANPGRWWLGTSPPTLDEARGKIVLLRRFGASVAKGINATYWPDNTNFNANNLVVEDHYVVNDYAGKWNFVTAGFNAAHADTNSSVLHLTYASGYDPQTFGIPNIQDVANYMNPRINSWFTDVKPGHYGCVIMDFADSGNTSLIFNSNFVRPGPIPDGVYQVLAKHSGSSLDVTGASTAAGVAVQQWQWGGGNNQRWTFANLGDGFYQISALHSGHCLDVEGSSTTNGARVLQYPNTGNANQQWRITGNGDGSFRFTNRHSGLVLDVEAASGANGAKVEQWSWNGGDNQRWLLQPVNRAPVFTTPARLYCCEGGPVSGSLSASDPDPGHSPVRFSKAGGPSWLNVAADGTISGTAPPDSAGDLTVTVLADDPAGAVASATLPITIQETPTWTQPAGGEWSQSANWRFGLIGGSANAPGVDFSTLDLTGNAVITLGSPVSLNQLVFGDIMPSHDWNLTGASALTLIGPSVPMITVTNQSTVIGVPVGGNNGLLKSGAGTLVFSGSNTLGGPVTVQQGTLAFAGTYASSALSIASGAVMELQVANGIRDYATSTIRGTGTLLKTGAGTARWGVQAGTFALGAGSLIDVRAGTLDAGSSANENWSGNLSSLHVNAGATINELTYGPAVFDALTGAGSVEGTGGSSLTLGVNHTAAGTYNPAGSANFKGVISSVSALIKIGTGTQILSGTNTYTGATTISGGTLQVGDGGNNGNLGSGNVLNNSILQFHRSDTYTVPNSISGSGAIHVKPGNDLTLSGAITCNTLRFHEGGNRTVRLTGSAANAITSITDSQDGHGTLVFSKTAGVNAFSGAVLDVGSGYASQFLLRLDNHEQIANTTQVAMYGWDDGYGGRSWFRLNGCNETIAGLVGGSSTSYVQNGAAGPSRLTLAGTGTYSVRGAVNDGGAGALSLVKSGNGTQTFSGNQIDFTGTTTVSGGKLLINGNKSGAGAVTVHAGGTLGGSGSVSGATTVASGGTLAPGANGIGAITFNHALTLAGGSSIAWEITNWTGAAGSGWDTAVVSSLDLTSATSANRITIRPAAVSLGNFSEASRSFLLVQATSGITGFDAAKFSIDTSGLTQPKGAWFLQQSGNNLMLVYIAPGADANGNGIFDHWEFARFGNINAGANRPDEDADRDGLSNLMEYALDTHPLVPNAGPVVDFETIDGARYLRLTANKNPQSTNLIYIVETSSALHDWSSADIVPEPVSAYPNRLIIRDKFSTSTAPRRFIRLRVRTAS